MTTKQQKPGLNLADLAPMYEDVPIGESFLRIRGISAKDGLEIFRRFPKLVGMVGTGFDLGTFLQAAPDAVAAVIATAAGEASDDPDACKAAEDAAAKLGVETQFDILEAIGGLTFTKGFAPFAERIMALAGKANSASYTRVPDMKSPPASKPSSQADTPPL